MDVIETFKKVMHEGMRKNFEVCGNLQPIVFFLYREDDKYRPIIEPLQGNFMGDRKYKQYLAETIRKICENPLVVAGGIISEAYGAKLTDDKTTEKLLKGDIKFSELDEKDDMIFMLFSTPVSEEFIAYVVDEKNKTIGENYLIDNNFISIFSGLFGWKKN